MFSQKGKYAIRAVLYISKESSPEKGLKGAKEIASSLNIPLAFTSKILLELSKQEIISSQKGPKGGFFLSKKNNQQPLINVLKSTGDDSFFSTCGLGLEACSDQNPCPIHHVFKDGRNALFNLFTQKTIKELSNEIIDKDLSLFIRS